MESSEAINDPKVCIIRAASSYGLSPATLFAVAEQEGGRVGQWVKNTNGTYDVGVMQFNTDYIKTLDKHGITPKHLESKGCYPYFLAAWRIATHLKNDQGGYWKKVANYHSRTEKFNAIYRAKIKKRAEKWDKFLTENKAKYMLYFNRKVVQNTSVPPTPSTINLQLNSVHPISIAKAKATSKSVVFNINYRN